MLQKSFEDYENIRRRAVHLFEKTSTNLNSNNNNFKRNNRFHDKTLNRNKNKNETIKTTAVLKNPNTSQVKIHNLTVMKKDDNVNQNSNDEIHVAEKCKIQPSSMNFIIICGVSSRDVFINQIFLYLLFHKTHKMIQRS